MRLLFISDSHQQWSKGPVQAIRLFHDERYVAVRQYLRNRAEQSEPSNLRVVIVSAKYGFISPRKEISGYSNGLTYDRVDQMFRGLQRQWLAGLDKWFTDDIDDLFLATTGPHLYALQRMEIAINQIPFIRRVQYMTTFPQVGDWLIGLGVPRDASSSAKDHYAS